jgi:CheY-like chemotaxis protein
MRDRLDHRPFVLVVDDDAGLSARYCALLEAAGYRTRAATSGRDALAIAARDRPRLVVIDLHLPDMTGATMVREIARRFSALPVIGLSDGDEPHAFGLLEVMPERGAAISMKKSLVAERLTDLAAELLRGPRRDPGMTDGDEDDL